MMRLFPPPWTVEALDGGFKVIDANGQTLAYVYPKCTATLGTRRTCRRQLVEGYRHQRAKLIA